MGRPRSMEAEGGTVTKIWGTWYNRQEAISCVERSSNMVDLHTHSTRSDGTLTPTELVRLAKEAGLKAIALTDHNTLTGFREAQEEGARTGLEVVPGVELSTSYEGAEIHILGYYIEQDNAAFLKKLMGFADGRDRRNRKMAKLLQKEGFDITVEDLEREYPGAMITRGHFSQYMAEHGMAGNPDRAFKEYLEPGCRCYVPQEKLSPFDAIGLVRLGNGVPVLAHPVLCPMADGKLRSLIGKLKEAGLAGIEAIYSMNEPEDEKKLLGLAEEMGLLVSGGSDFHGARKPHIQLGTGRGGLHVPDCVLEGIKEWHRTHVQAG